MHVLCRNSGRIISTTHARDITHNIVMAFCQTKKKEDFKGQFTSLTMTYSTNTLVPVVVLIPLQIATKLSLTKFGNIMKK